MEDSVKKALAYLAEAIGPDAALGVQRILAGDDVPRPAHILDEVAAEAKRKGYMLLRN